MKFKQIINIELIIFNYLDNILIDSRLSQENIKRKENNIRNKKYI